MFDQYLQLWNLTPDGNPTVTISSHLLPVIYQNTLSMLKVARVAEEKFGGKLMVWWEGQGAARVLAHTEDALLLERAAGTCCLTDFVQDGHDDEASKIICAVVAKLHIPKTKPCPELVPLSLWFQALEPVARTHGGILSECAAMACQLLESSEEVGILHGDIHHGNILDFGQRGWLAIDPKGLYGERGFDYANLFCNPCHDIAANRGVFRRRVETVAKEAELEHKRLLQWVMAWVGLSAAWFLNDNVWPRTRLAVAELAFAEYQS